MDNGPRARAFSWSSRPRRKQKWQEEAAVSEYASIECGLLRACRHRCLPLDVRNTCASGGHTCRQRGPKRGRCHSRGRQQDSNAASWLVAHCESRACRKRSCHIMLRKSMKSCFGHFPEQKRAERSNLYGWPVKARGRPLRIPVTVKTGGSSHKGLGVIIHWAPVRER